MTYLRQTKGIFLVGAFLTGLLLFGFTQRLQAEEREFRHREFREFRDLRHHHDHFYPARGQFIDVLPRGHRVVFFGRERFFFFEGVWYRPAGRRFLIVAPPIGLVVPFLPPYYSTVWVSGVPYYYANEVYYTQSPGGYVITVPPSEEVVQTPPPSGPMPGGPRPGGQMPASPMPGGPMPGNQIFIYPRQGQSPEKQADDRVECLNWAISQVGYDPNRPPVGLAEAQKAQKIADYRRAMEACLDARGYSMK
ncbi:MAG: DUF6515 family protein [Thermodesulfobacteriota bacterium]